MARLDATTVRSLPAGVAVPRYDRAAVRPGIVHLGVGGFHRAHQAVYLDRLMQQGQALDWGVTGVGVRPEDRRLHEVLTAQDGLYTLQLAAPDGSRERQVVGSLLEHLLAPDDPAAVLGALTRPETRVVTLTVTEGGWALRPGTREFDPAAPGIAADLRPGAVPGTAVGLLTEALVRRRARGVPPFTVVSCDNLTGNGDVAGHAVAGFAALRDPALGDWVRASVHFPNSMVDRITPVTTDADRAEVSAALGVDDGWPVVAEPWLQWVLEDSFGCGRPPLEDAGVQLVADVAPYELMKLRLLNAGHQVLAHLGSLAGHTYAHEAANDPALRDLLAGWMAEEVTPTLAPVPGIDLADYRGQLLARFANPHVRDTLARLCVDGSVRVPTFLLPVVRDRLAAGQDVARSALAVAAWARWAEGADDAGRPLELVDPRRDELRAAARRQRTDPLAFLADRELFGDLADDERFTGVYRASLRSLHERGAAATVRAVLAGALPG